MNNKYVQAVLVFVVIVGGYALYVNLTLDNNPPQEAPQNVEEIIPAIEVLEAEDLEPEEDFTGTHIMPDGTVMKGNGDVIPGATILPDANIELSDGTIITPAFDLRKKKVEPVDTVNMVEFEVVGTNFAFDVEEIRVKKGDVVTINFVSEERFHDLVIDEFDAATDRVDEGGRTSVTFTADTIGTFEYYCSVKGHREKGQVGNLIVE